MRSTLENAISRRDDRLIRTRQLTLWIAGGATAASIGLASCAFRAVAALALVTIMRGVSSRQEQAAARPGKGA